MADSIDKMCVGFGLLILLHAAYSAAQHRSYLRLTEQEFHHLPLDILLQCLCGLVLTCYGIVHVAGKFKEIKSTANVENKTWENLSNRLSFYTFNHRGQVFHGR